jgi:hypothetical protein
LCSVYEISRSPAENKKLSEFAVRQIENANSSKISLLSCIFQTFTHFSNKAAFSAERLCAIPMGRFVRKSRIVVPTFTLFIVLAEIRELLDERVDRDD